LEQWLKLPLWWNCFAVCNRQPTFCNQWLYLHGCVGNSDTVEPLLSGLMTGCHWLDNQSSQTIEDHPKTTC
jgi:hypothetical protein